LNAPLCDSHLQKVVCANDFLQMGFREVFWLGIAAEGYSELKK
jgi:hypothetical protein